MKVCVSEELENIKNELINRGYNVIGNSDSTYDAIICNLKNGGLQSFNLQNNTNREGTIIIDSGSRTVDEIEYLLNNRVSSQ